MNPKTLMAGLAGLAMFAACGGGGEGGGDSRGGGMSAMMGGGGGEQAAVPVEVTRAERRSISAYIETNGTLEAENEVDIVARVSGPVVQLEAEETMRVRKGDLLARIDPREIDSQREIARVTLEETRLAFERAKRLREDDLVSLEAYEDAKAAFESAQAQYSGIEIQYGYTSIEAPFDGLIVERYIKNAEHVAVGQQLFRISDFDPLLCPIQVPERNIPSLKKGQRAHLRVEAWPGERFDARVLRISPVVDAATGTVRVTLEVSGEGRLSPGMFASVYLETEQRPDAIVIPKAALALESIGDTVYVAGDGVAERREVELGFREGDFIEILSGVEEGEQVVTVGQDGLAEGTPIQILDPNAPAPTMASFGSGGPPGGAGAGGGRPDTSSMSPEQLERMKARMKSFGMTDDQIEARLKSMGSEGRQEGEATTSAVTGAAGSDQVGGQGPDVSEMTPEQIEQMKARLKASGLTDEQIETRLEGMRKRQQDDSGEGLSDG